MNRRQFAKNTILASAIVTSIFSWWVLNRVSHLPAGG